MAAMSNGRSPSEQKRIKISRFGLSSLLPFFVAIVFGLTGSALIYFSDAAPSDYDTTGLYVAPNPLILNQSCTGGLNIAFVADASGSVADKEEWFSQMKTAMKGFVSGLLPSTPTMFSITQFGDDATVVQPFTSNVTSLYSAINNISKAGRTNWTAGLQKGYGTFAGISSTKPKLLIIATDGDPNRPNGEQEALRLAISQANTIKNAGVHILVLGIGSDPTITNMQAISGTRLNNGGVNADVITTNFATMGATLQTIARSTCGIGNGSNGSGTNGNGTGTGGTGSGTGTGGTGSGTGGTGTGTNGSGTGATGTGTGTTTSTKPKPSPTPAPSTTQSTTPTPTPTQTESPDPSPAPAAVESTEPEPEPAPTETAQGTQTTAPDPQPSPFYDGKEYAPGSANDELADMVIHRSVGAWAYAVPVLIALAGVGVYAYWRKRRSSKPVVPAPRTKRGNG